MRGITKFKKKKRKLRPIHINKKRGRIDHLSQRRKDSLIQSNKAVRPAYQVVKPKGRIDHLSRFNLVVKPINWKGIKDRYPEYSSMKGEFGEQIVKECLEERGMKLEKQESRAPGLPDFRIKDTQMFVEVKTHERKTPPIWQKPLFSMMAKMGWQIFVAQPRVSITEQSVTCRQIDWFRFQNNGKLDRLNGFPIAG